MKAGRAAGGAAGSMACARARSAARAWGGKRVGDGGTEACEGFERAKKKKGAAPLVQNPYPPPHAVGRAAACAPSLFSAHGSPHPCFTSISPR
jgi:hypothetical protein